MDKHFKSNNWIDEKERENNYTEYKNKREREKNQSEYKNKT